MAEEADRESKTEEASQRRIEDAKAKGNTPFSREAANAAVLLAIGLTLPIAVAAAAAKIAPSLTFYLDMAPAIRLETGGDAIALIAGAGLLIAASLWPLLLAVALAGILASAAQNVPRIVLHRIKPELSRLSPSKGLERIYGAAGRVEIVKSALKLVAICGLLYAALRHLPLQLPAVALVAHDGIVPIVAQETARLFLLAGLLMIALAAADVLWSRQKWRMDLRMSRQELKDEQRQNEGDPMVKARQRAIARNRARKRMMAAVPRATLVVANPTHYAIALRYVAGETVAPVVLAKGIDHLALRIREIAERNDIPVIEDKALARSLYAAVKTDRPIPPEFYRAVAEIMLHLMMRDAADPSKPALALPRIA